MAEMQSHSQGRAQQGRLMINIALWSGLVFTAAAVVRVGLWRPATPQPAALNPGLISSLQSSGWSIQARTPDAYSGEEVSWAGGLALVNAQRHPGAVLSLVPVRARGPSTYTLEMLVRPVAGSDGTQTKVMRFGNHERARMKLITKQEIEAACMTRGVALADPNRMLATKLEQERLSTLKQQLERLAGLRQTRSWDCLLVVVRQPVNRDDSTIWNGLAETLGSWDGQGN